LSNTLYIKVDNLASVIASYDQIKVYKSATETGTFSEVTGPGTRVVLSSQDSLYIYVDDSGIETDWYKSSYFNSSNLAESALSEASQGTSVGQLLENMQVVITLNKEIKDVNGNRLGEDQEFYFTTKYLPMYTGLQRIRLDIGTFIRDIPDDTINLAIYEASVEVDAGTFSKENAAQGTDYYKHARRMWTICRAEEILLNNLINGSGGMLKAKRLADFEVEYDSLAIQNVLKSVKDCQAAWEAEVVTGGFAIQTPRGVVKGDLDIDRPSTGRLWDEPVGTPGGNATVRYSGSRRWLKTWIPRYKKNGRF
jgi:hypothetical protein